MKLSKMQKKLARDIASGDFDVEKLSAWKDQDAASAVLKLAEKYANKKTGDFTFVGRVVSETEKAILFRFAKFNRAEIWLPKSQVKIAHRSVGSAAEITMPKWLYDQNKSEIKG